MDTLQFHDLLDDKFGDTRPTTSDFIIVDEDTHQIIIEWHEDLLSVNLYVWPHSDFQDIVPNTEEDCEYYDGDQTNPSTLSDSPTSMETRLTLLSKQ